MMIHIMGVIQVTLRHYGRPTPPAEQYSGEFRESGSR